MIGLSAIVICHVAVIPMANAATEADMDVAISKGMDYLYRTQNVAGSWGSSGYEQAATGAATFALLAQRDKWGDKTAHYQGSVDAGIAYLIRTANTIDVSTRSDGVNICPGGAAFCKGVYWYGNSASVYTTGLVAPAIATYGIAVGLNRVAVNSGPLAAMTWGQIAQAITNALAFSQSTN